MDAASLLHEHKIVPVVVIDHAECAVPLAEALLAGGIRAIEVTLRTDCALQAIEDIAAKVPEMFCGAGSVCHPSQLHAVRAAGASFAVSPGGSSALIEAAADFPLVPGAATATEVLNLADQYSLLKFFPAELLGGVAMLKALSAPIPDVRFFPTGGISLANIGDYLAFDRIASIGGTWIAPRDDIAGRRFETITERAAEAATLVAARA